MTSQDRNLIVGTGKLGRRFYDYLQSKKQSVITLSRSPKAWSKQHICYDLLKNDQAFPKLPQLNKVFIILAPGERSESAYRQTYITAVSNLVSHLHQQQTDFHCVFVSSTSVYAANTESVINEHIVPKPDSFSGQILLEAEKNVKSLHASTSIVRPSGLYSSQRQRLIDSLLDPAQYDNPKWLNLIHEQDICQWLWQAAINQWSLTIASDGFPFQRKQLQDFQQSLPDVETPSLPDHSAKRYLSLNLDQIKLQYPSIFHWLQSRM
ncbi:sugar nucleotide-binding protein [Kangiella sp.]|uniref:sugar nucleotide-binding protein n=1 Tax=Kangiella sp. TaxID=1920245 RepID=UPI0019913EB9|nr:sugar nucleotide-binding protein [Kangiella sp.]MBD3653459.1 sugar nucleotide-binding protein [Kangiella sp.]